MAEKLDVFNQILTVSLLQPLSLSQTDFKSYRTKVNLRISEQRNEASGEKEVKFEISRRNDFEFLYAEVLNNEKYQNLARDFDLTVDFDTFPKVIVQHHLCKKIAMAEMEDEIDSRLKDTNASDAISTEIIIIMEAEKTSCAFELFSKTPVSKGKLFSIKLYAVRGDLLISHLLKICSSHSVELKSLRKSTEQLNILRNESDDIKTDAANLRMKMIELEKNLRLADERNRELEDELELVKEERENIRVLAEEKELLVDELQTQFENASKNTFAIKEELEIVGRMLKEEQTKVDQMNRKCLNQQKDIGRLKADNVSLSKNVERLTRINNNSEHQQQQQSVDIRKLKELEADSQEKDSIIIALTETANVLRKELDDEKLKLQELGGTCDSLKTENDEIKEKLIFYRCNRLFSPSNLSREASLVNIGASKNIYKSVLGFNENGVLSGTPRHEKNAPFTDGSALTNPATPHNSRNAHHQMNGMNPLI